MTENPIPEIQIGDWVRPINNHTVRIVVEVRPGAIRMIGHQYFRDIRTIAEIRKADGTRWLRTPEGRTE